jgi:Kelch motif protein/S-layer family protein
MRKFLLMTVALSVAALAAFPAAVSAQSCNPYTNGAWVAKAPVPTTISRAWGVFFPGNGKFYAMGGRQTDAAGSDFVNPREFNPTTNSWAVKTAAYPNLQVCNMVGGVLTIGGQSVIVTVGGSAALGTTATSDVRQYDPVTDTLTVLATDPWPGNVGGTVLPGGAAVVNNVLYVFGGFNIGVGMTSQIWKFNPALAAGSRWTLVPTALPAARGYIPTAASGGMIYLAGGSDFVGGTLVDSNQSLRFDPATNALTAIAPIPRATAETRAVTHPFDNTIWVLGGGRTAPNPSTEVDVYNPTTNTWSTAPPMTTARRNFAADVDPQTARIFAAGGYDTTGTTLVALNDQFTCTVPATAVALVVDAAGNGVYQPNETVVVAPSWMNTGATAVALTGALTNHTGPAGPVYTIPDGAADYGTLATGATASCTATGNCYSVANATATRPATHWDSTAVETLAPTGSTKTWTLHIGNSFTDVPPTSGFYRFIETILHKNVTGGCTATTYCPTASTTREQMAVFVLVAKEPTGFNPPACVAGSERFTDVPASSGFCKWVEELARRGVVGGCTATTYCPTASATREQMAVFVLRTLDPALNPVACVAGSEMFSDVPASSGFCKWIEELVRRGVVTGCGGGNYCPTADVTREQMGVFLTVTFGLTLYGL